MPNMPAGEVAARMDRDGAAVCVVVNERGVVQGWVRRDRIDAADRRNAEEVMEPGLRPSGPTQRRLRLSNV
jgi:hypothetical protein